MSEVLVMGDFKAQLDDDEAQELRVRFAEGGPGLTNLALPRGVHPNLAAALAAVQAEVPEVVKAERAKIDGKEGKRGYEYSYADLAAVTRAILPIMGRNGLAWITKPTLHEGRMVLHYKLVHASGQSEEGFYPLPDRGSPQDMGGAITYARRYCLCSVSGVAPDDDDDDAAEATASHRRGQLTTPPISEFERKTGLALLRVPTDEERAAVGRDHAAAAFQQALDFRACLDEKAAWGNVASADGEGHTWEALFRTRVEAEIAAAGTPAAWRAVRDQLNAADLGRAYADQLKGQADRVRDYQLDLINRATHAILNSTSLAELDGIAALVGEYRQRGIITAEQAAEVEALVGDRRARLDGAPEDRS